MSVTLETKLLKSAAKAALYDARGITPCSYRGADMPAPIASSPGNKWSGAGAISICLQCGTEIRHKPSHRRKFCSKPCRIAFERDLARSLNSRPCATCGKAVYRPPAHLKRSAVHYCSHACHGKANRGAANTAYAGGLVSKSCETCGTEFSVKRGVAARAQYCSRSCHAHAKWAADAFSRSKLSARSCSGCGKEFMPHWRGSAYCSRRCASAAHSGRITGRGNGRFVHGKARRKYPTAWTVAHKAVIRARDGERCLRCGRARDEKQNLHVHHIDYNKGNLNPSNLITLCRFCHGKMHGSHRQRAQWKRELSLLLSQRAGKISSITFE